MLIEARNIETYLRQRRVMDGISSGVCLMEMECNLHNCLFMNLKEAMFENVGSAVCFQIFERGRIVLLEFSIP
jgi:hypothetical protein